MLKLENVVAGYGRTRILHGLSLEVPRGGLVALLGGNGTGKSTCLKAIAGLVTPQDGTVALDGRVINDVAAEDRTAMGLSLVPQGKEIFGGMSVAENLMMGAYHRRRDKAGVAADLEGVYARFPRLKERRRVLAGMLSGGERQMLSIGRALMSRPKLLLLDEPSMGLAPVLVDQVFEIIQRLNREDGVTVFLVEQNAFAALSIATRGYVIETGEIAMEGKGAALLADERVREAYLGV